MKTAKAEIRERLKAERLALPISQAAKASREIVSRCIELVDWEHIRTLHCYVPVLSENEPDSWHVLEYAWRNHPQITTAVPVRNKVGEYDSVTVTPQTKWHSRDVRIPRPLDGEILPADFQFDTIIVPMLGFDSRGYRLGHGLGWYDRFLATQPDAQTIGLCYGFGFVSGGLPREPHDIPVDCVVTEQAVVPAGYSARLV